MYTTFFRFFGLRDNPFTINPDPGYLYVDHRIQTVLDDMASAIQARKGLIILTGEPGTGKTTLLNRLMQWLKEQKTPTAFIFNPHLELHELFDFLFANFAIPTEPDYPDNPWMRLNRWSIERYRMDMNAVVILDEAQGLPVPLLAEIRLLLNHQIQNEGLMQIVLSGQPELEEKLKRPELRQLRQRIGLRCRTTALTLQQAREYVRKRVHLAGGNSEKVFAPEAIDTAYQYSQGIPRLMNLLSERAMIQAYLGHTQPVPASSVEEAARQLQFDEVKPVAGRPKLETNLTASAAVGLSEPLADSAVPAEFAAEERKVLPVTIPAVRDSMRRAVLQSAMSDSVKLEPVLSTASPKSAGSHSEGQIGPSPISELRAKTDSIRELMAELASAEANSSPVPQSKNRMRRAAVSSFEKDKEKVREKDHRTLPDFLNPRPILLQCVRAGGELRAVLALLVHRILRKGRDVLAMARSAVRRTAAEPSADRPRSEGNLPTGSAVVSAGVTDRVAEERKVLPVTVPVVRESMRRAVFQPALSDGVKMAELASAEASSSPVSQSKNRIRSATVSGFEKDKVRKKGHRTLPGFLNPRPILLKGLRARRELRAAVGTVADRTSRGAREALVITTSRVWQENVDSALRWLRGPFLKTASAREPARRRETLELWKSLASQTNIQSAIRWLQQPFPTLKLHRRAGH